MDVSEAKEDLETDKSISLPMLFNFVTLNYKFGSLKDIKIAINTNDKMIRTALYNNTYMSESEAKIYLPNIFPSENFKDKVELDLTLSDKLSSILQQKKPTQEQISDITNKFGKNISFSDEYLNKFVVPSLLTRIHSLGNRKINSDSAKFCSDSWKLYEEFLTVIAYNILMP